MIDISKEVLEELYINQKLNATKIAKIYNCDKTTIGNKLRKYNIPIKSIFDAHAIYTYNYNYFSAPTIENCYWAGFIASDGNIYKRENEKSLRLYVGLSLKDKLQLTRFKGAVQYNGPIYDRISPPSSITHKQKKYYSCEIKIYSQQICNDLLENWNITPRKSLTLQPPNITNKEQILSYIIGYIDGDGCISYAGKTKRLTLSIIGTKELLEWINSQFNNIGTLGKDSRTKNNTKTLVFSGSKCRLILRELKNHIQKYNLLVLNRKWDKVTEEKLQDSTRDICNKITPEHIFKEIEKGKSRRQLGKELNCSQQTISRKLKQYEDQLC